MIIFISSIWDNGLSYFQTIANYTHKIPTNIIKAKLDRKNYKVFLHSFWICISYDVKLSQGEMGQMNAKI